MKGWRKKVREMVEGKMEIKEKETKEKKKKK